MLHSAFSVWQQKIRPWHASRLYSRMFTFFLISRSSPNFLRFKTAAFYLGKNRHSNCRSNHQLSRRIESIETNGIHLGGSLNKSAISLQHKPSSCVLTNQFKPKFFELFSIDSFWNWNASALFDTPISPAIEGVNWSSQNSLEQFWTAITFPVDQINWLIRLIAKNSIDLFKTPLCKRILLYEADSRSTIRP